MKCAIALLLASAPSFADVPGGHVYFGAGAWFARPTRDATYGNDGGFSVELQYEQPYFVAGVSGATGVKGTFFGPMFSAYAGLTIPLRVAPYLAAGVAFMGQTVNTHFDCYGGCITTVGSGPALLLEGGILLLRNLRIGRIELVGRIVVPQFNAPNGYNGITDYPSVGFVVFGIRLLG